MPTLNLHPVDIAIVVVYMVMLVGVGIYHSRRQDSILEFFMAHKGMTWVPVGISLMAALNSGMDYLNIPSAVIRLGWLNILIRANGQYYQYRTQRLDSGGRHCRGDPLRPDCRRRVG